MPPRTVSRRKFLKIAGVTLGTSVVVCGGATGEVAIAIGKTLAQNGAHVDVMPLKKVTDLTRYQVVFIGSAIRVG